MESFLDSPEVEEIEVKEAGWRMLLAANPAIGQEASRALARHYRVYGKAKYLDKLVRGNLKLVVHACKSHLSDWSSLCPDDQDEYFSAAASAFSKACESWKPEKGALSTHAWHPMQAAIRLTRGLGKPIQLSEHEANQLRKVFQADEELRSSPPPGPVTVRKEYVCGQLVDVKVYSPVPTPSEPPSRQEIAEEVSRRSPKHALDEDKVAYLLNATADPVSIYVEENGEGEEFDPCDRDEFHDLSPGPFQMLQDAQLRAQFWRLAGQVLTPQETSILEAFCTPEEPSQACIAAQAGISQPRVCELLGSAIAKIKSHQEFRSLLVR